ncbi:unnamed protein product [Musa acuminata subsp. malaccensis]|uniref:(wild Malaysian banana) hypothetical protein n=1 Tax=Musa acuminata subsp. malaccensis TaxID=214687 RepID=A0A8D7F1F6_MUSAM|nr:unnamed protein product [Musa acuminata subsp. malaccensis]
MVLYTSSKPDNLQRRSKLKQKDPLIGTPTAQVHDCSQRLLRLLPLLRRRLPPSPPPVDGGRCPLGLRQRPHAALRPLLQGFEDVVPPAQPRLILERLHRAHARCHHQTSRACTTHLFNTSRV